MYPRDASSTVNKSCWKHLEQVSRDRNMGRSRTGIFQHPVLSWLPCLIINTHTKKIQTHDEDEVGHSFTVTPFIFTFILVLPKRFAGNRGLERNIHIWTTLYLRCVLLTTSSSRTVTVAVRTHNTNKSNSFVMDLDSRVGCSNVQGTLAQFLWLWEHGRVVRTLDLFYFLHWKIINHPTLEVLRNC